MQVQVQELQQLITDDARSFIDARRVLNKLARSTPSVWLARATSPPQPPAIEQTVQSHSAFAAVVCSNMHGNVSFDILCTPGHTDVLNAVCLALMDHYKDIKAFKFTGVDKSIAGHLEDAYTSLGCMKLHYEPCDRMRLSATPSEVLELPGAAYVMDTLALSDVQDVNDNWTYKSSYSMDLITDMISKYHTTCIRLKSTGKAVCWVLEYPDGSIGMLFTQPEHRSKGLAKICMQDIVKKLLAAGSDEVFCYVTKGNVASCAVLNSVGFVSSGDFIWMGFSRPAGAVEDALARGVVLPGP
jgi:hypothetical protein